MLATTTGPARDDSGQIVELTTQAEIAPLSDDRNDQVMTLANGKTPCNCSDNCPGLTTRYFSQGHDARMVTRLRDAVLADEVDINDAFAEVIRRGGTERLQIKLDAAVANARKPRKAKRGGAAAKAIDTFELGEFCLAAMPLATETQVVAKVGRWEYRGEILTYQIIEDGKVSKGDTVLVFEYDNKQGERHQTLSYTRVAVDEEFDAVEAEVIAEPDNLPILVSLRGDASSEAAREEVAALAADEDTSDIPF